MSPTSYQTAPPRDVFLTLSEELYSPEDTPFLGFWQLRLRRAFALATLAGERFFSWRGRMTYAAVIKGLRRDIEAKYPASHSVCADQDAIARCDTSKYLDRWVLVEHVLSMIEEAESQIAAGCMPRARRILEDSVCHLARLGVVSPEDLPSTLAGLRTP